MSATKKSSHHIATKTKKANSSGKESSSTLVSIGPKALTKASGCIPKYTIKDKSGNSHVEFTLDAGEKIFAQPYYLSYMDANVNLTTKNRASLVSGIKRLLFTSTSLYTSIYTAKKDDCKLGFASFLPGQIVSIKINPGEEFIAKQSTVICMTENVHISTSLNLKGIVVSEDLFNVRVYVDANSKEPGMFWLAPYGGYEKMAIPAGESMIVDNGMFLCINKNTSFSIAKFAGWMDSWLSGEGLGLRFHGPCELYIQNRNIGDLRNYIWDIAQTVVNVNKKK